MYNEPAEELEFSSGLLYGMRKQLQDRIHRKYMQDVEHDFLHPSVKLYESSKLKSYRLPPFKAVQSGSECSFLAGSGLLRRSGGATLCNLGREDRCAARGGQVRGWASIKFWICVASRHGRAQVKNCAATRGA